MVEACNDTEIVP